MNFIEFEFGVNFNPNKLIIINGIFARTECCCVSMLCDETHR